MSRDIVAPVPTMPAERLAARRARLGTWSRPQLEAVYFGLRGRRGGRTLMSDAALVEVLAWSDEVDDVAPRPISFAGADGDLVE